MQFTQVRFKQTNNRIQIESLLCWTG